MSATTKTTCRALAALVFVFSLFCGALCAQSSDATTKTAASGDQNENVNDDYTTIVTIVPTANGPWYDLVKAGCDPRSLDYLLVSNGYAATDIRFLWKRMMINLGGCKHPSEETIRKSKDDIDVDVAYTDAKRLSVAVAPEKPAAAQNGDTGDTSKKNLVQSAPIVPQQAPPAKPAEIPTGVDNHDAVASSETCPWNRDRCDPGNINYNPAIALRDVPAEKHEITLLGALNEILPQRRAYFERYDMAGTQAVDLAKLKDENDSLKKQAAVRANLEIASGVVGVILVVGLGFLVFRLSRRNAQSRCEPGESPKELLERLGSYERALLTVNKKNEFLVKQRDERLPFPVKHESLCTLERVEFNMHGVPYAEYGCQTCGALGFIVELLHGVPDFGALEKHRRGHEFLSAAASPPTTAIA